ncbi:Tat-binding 7 [Spathaspora sp. JA1]|nr:Tat-binding 7 [Spathaspora sp. JA1]
MTRRGNPRHVPDDDGDFDVGSHDNEELPPRRSRASRVASYKEEEGEDFDEQDEETPKVEQEKEKVVAEEEEEEEDPFEDSSTEKDDGGDDYIEDGNGDLEDDEQISSRRRKRGRKQGGRNKQILSDDEFQDDGDDYDDDDIVSDDDDFVEKIKQRNFIIEDEEDNEEDNAYGISRPKKKKAKKAAKLSRSASPKRSTRSGKPFGVEEPLLEPENANSDEDDIQKEIADLYDSSPIKEGPVQHKLRERAKVDYTIPPPMTNESMFATFPRANTPKRGRGRPNYNKSEFRKILYPTAGPFGGSDVISLFGTNIPPGGIPIQTIPGMPQPGGAANLTAIGQNLSDSDSSEDEIAPINGEATVSKKVPKLKSKKPTDNKKKSTLSDTDPLGVDMNIDFSVVGGLDNYINQLKEMVALPLLYPELYQNFGITPPRGVLFHGPPGTGKTLMARALAASCSTSERKITFFMRKGADCLSKWVGEAERQLRLLFEEAKNQQPSIIFFDEIDGLAPVRSAKQEQIHASIVSTLLALMDGMDNRGQVIVIGATNRPDSIDPALRRPGRFDREFYFPLPDISARLEILQIHTRKWQPELPSIFLKKLAELTKGYGGADLRALCTEAALNSIQRKYPQIYSSNEKLKINPKKVTVIAQDFMKAMEKIVPSSARSTSSGSSPLPEHLAPLLESNFQEITSKLNELLPGIKNSGKVKTTLEEAKYLDPSINDQDGGFSKHQLLKSLDTSRIFKPHLLISGPQGNGQQYLGAAILNHLEGFQIQSLDLGNMFGDVTRTPESTIVQAFVEARRHQPSIIYIPNIEVWFNVVPYTARATLISLFRGLKSNERVLMLGISDCQIEELDQEIKTGFGFGKNSNCMVELQTPNQSQREKYFASLVTTLHMKPFEFINDLENRPLRKLKQLKIVQEGNKPSDEEMTKTKTKQQEYQDTKLKNILKIKLAGLMDLFKNRYKRFKKPIIDDNFLIHLFDPSILENPLNLYEVLYVKSEDPEHKNMIKELTTGRYYYNIDLDIIEERLWNGYYSEPKQFLKDIKMIVRDSITSGDRERILKANEMLTNAQFGIDDFSTPEFLKNCREVRERDLKKQQKLLDEHKKLQEQIEKQQEELGQTLTHEEIVTENDKEHVNGVVVNTDPGAAVVVNSELELSNEIVNEITVPEALNEEVATESKDIVPEVVPAAAEQVQETAKEEPEPPLESDPESEAEDINIDESKQLILDEDNLQNLNKQLVDITDTYNIEQLENVMAKLMDIVWKDRNQWDKSETLQNLKTAIESL